MENQRVAKKRIRRIKKAVAPFGTKDSSSISSTVSSVGVCVSIASGRACAEEKENSPKIVTSGGYCDDVYQPRYKPA
jgi:hypothetical protein